MKVKRQVRIMAVVYIVSCTTVLAFYYTQSAWTVAVFAVSFFGANMLKENSDE